VEGCNVAALERSDNVADRSHAFAVLKRGYTRRQRRLHNCSVCLKMERGRIAVGLPAGGGDRPA